MARDELSFDGNASTMDFSQRIVAATLQEGTAGDATVFNGAQNVIQGRARATRRAHNIIQGQARATRGVHGITAATLQQSIPRMYIFTSQISQAYRRLVLLMTNATELSAIQGGPYGRLPSNSCTAAVSHVLS